MSDIERRIREALRDPRRGLPPWPEPMPRIRRAARRQRARLLAGGSAAIAITVVAIVISLIAPASRRPLHYVAAPPISCAAPAAEQSSSLGRLVEVRGQSLVEFSLGTGRSLTLVRDGGAAIVNQAPAFSHDGRWVAFGNASVVSSAGGPVASVLGRTQVDQWTWSASGDELAAVTAQRGVVIGGPGLRPRTVLPAGWGAYDVAFSPCRPELAVSRYPYCTAPATCHVDRGIWLIDLRTGRADEVFSERKDYALQLAGWSPDGRWILFQPDFDSAASLGADGLPLDAVAATGSSPPIQVLPIELTQPLTWCRGTLVQSAGELRYTFQNKHLVAAAPPRWGATPVSDDARLGWMLPACATDGSWVAATVAPNTSSYTFTQPSQIWLLRPNGSRPHLLIGDGAGQYQLTPLGWSADSRWILFQRMQVKPTMGAAQFFLAEVSDAGQLVGIAGPVASAPLSLGTAPLVDGQLVLPYGWYQP
jgi:hypothetical protein